MATIQSRQAFIAFLQQLHQDYLANRQDWENDSLDKFLEALASYAQEIPGYYQNMRQDTDADIASWQVFADMLLGAKVYE